MSFNQGQTIDKSPLNKRRRFAPNQIPVIVSNDDSDSPLILQFCDPSPSQQEIEAQLLQVGMRIRKSINDGYQNTPGRRAFTPRPFFNSHRLSPDTLSALSSSANSDANFSAGGLHNVGAMAMQPISTATFCGINLAAMSHVTSAQPIEEQKLWSYSTSSKRRMFDDDSDSDDSQEFMPRTPQLECADAGIATPQDYFNINPDSMGDVSAMTQNGELQPQFPSRRMAKPRSRARAIPQKPVAMINPFAQVAAPRPHFSGHRRMTSCGVEANLEFGEAMFLHPRQDVEMDWS